MRGMRGSAVTLAALVLFLVALPAAAQQNTPPGDYALTLEYDGLTRDYLLHVPPGYDGAAPAPLVMGLHGAFGSARQFERMANMNSAADARGFVAVYPEGTGPVQTWNAGHCCGPALWSNVDDVGFILALVDELEGMLAIDPDRIYVTGLSNGAMLAYRLAAEAPEVFAAAGIVAGSIGGRASERSSLVTLPAPDTPVSIIALHGRQDRAVRYDGGESLGALDFERSDLSVAEAMAFWTAANACEALPATESLFDGVILHDVYGCPDDVGLELYTIVDGDHSWPGAAPTPFSQPTRLIDATDLILDFFEAHPKP